MNDLTKPNQIGNINSKQTPITEKVIDFFANCVEYISTKVYRLNGIENIPKECPFLLISNHPGNFDYFPLKNALDITGVEVDFFVHKNLLSHPLTKGYSQRNRFLGVRRFDYENKYKIPGANTANVNGIREGIGRFLQQGTPLGIFISGEGHMEGMEKVFRGYRLIIKKLLESEIDNVTIVPVTISGHEIYIHPPKDIYNYDNDVFEDIENSMRKYLVSINYISTSQALSASPQSKSME